MNAYFLKPCPACGKEVEIVRIGGGWFWRHKDNPDDQDCILAHSRKYDTEEEAVARWNGTYSTQNPQYIAVRNNSLARMVSELSFEELKACYHNIVEWRETGTLDSVANIREIYARVNEKLPHVDLHRLNDALLLEMSRRFLNMQANTQINLHVGDAIYYLYDDNGDIEAGTITALSYKAGELFEIGVCFDNDADAFTGNALGSCLFATKEAAQRYYQQHNK